MTTTTRSLPYDAADGPHCLCCNCGGIAPCDTFDALRRDGAPTVLRCPLCRWEHRYDDSSLGLRSGTRAEMEYERFELARDPVWTGIWGDGPGETPAASDATAPRP